MPSRKYSIDLMSVFSDYSPRLMSNGQIRMECPFRENHSDGSGRMSFFVSPDINAYHCFSCQKKGNLIKLITGRFKVPYFEAVNMVRIVPYEKEKEEFDLDVMWDITKPPSEFMRRGYTKDTLRHFRVGTMDDGGMVIPYYSDFNTYSELLGYQKRWYSPDRRVRNSKGFDKKGYLYNLDTNYDYTILVEGQSDVWRLYQHGYNACALMGVSVSPEQCEKLGDFKTVYLALDNDEAGLRGTEACYYSLKNHVDILLVPYLTKDPGECLNAEDWKKFMNGSTDYVEYSLGMTLNWPDYLDIREEVLSELMRNG